MHLLILFKNASPYCFISADLLLVLLLMLYFVQVPRQECKQVPRQECKQVPREVTNFVSEQDCKTITEKQCTQIPEQVCH